MLHMMMLHCEQTDPWHLKPRLQSLAIGAVAPLFANPWPKKQATDAKAADLSIAISPLSQACWYRALCHASLTLCPTPSKAKAWQSIPQKKPFSFMELELCNRERATKIQPKYSRIRAYKSNVPLFQDCPKTVSRSEYLVDKNWGPRSVLKDSLGVWRVAHVFKDCCLIFFGLCLTQAGTVPASIEMSSMSSMSSRTQQFCLSTQRLRRTGFSSDFWGAVSWTRSSRTATPAPTCSNGKGKIDTLKTVAYDKRLFSHCCKSLIGRMDRISFSVAMHLFGSWQPG